MHNHIFSILLTVICLFGFSKPISAQEKNESKPVVLYSGIHQKYEIGGIEVEGATNHEDYLIIGLSGLSIGQTISVPGKEITQAVKRYWRNGLFSKVKITAEKIVGKKVYLKITLAQRPRISSITYRGTKKSEKEDLQLRLGLTPGNQITPNVVDRAKLIIKRYYDEKGFKNADVNIIQKDDPKKENQLLVYIVVDKKEKIKVHHIQIDGNLALKDSKIKRVMKKTNEKNKLLNIFKTKKFIKDNYEEDKQNIIDKYNELGYRDARILKDSVVQYDEKSVDIFLKIEEGKRYHLRDVKWIGNTLYPAEQLNYMLRMKTGDVYNQKLLNDRLMVDEDAIGNLYYNNGYVFYRLEPVEVNIENDSIDLEMRIHEGTQATINKIRINGNDRVYENVVRRELRTKPGQLFSREDLMRSLRELQQMGHFDQEKIQPDVQPNPENGTVDIGYNLVSKSSDQVEFSAGWGQTGVIGKLSLKLTNFSLENLLHPGKNHRGIIPKGDGQTLTISGQTNADYYQSYSISFFDPWFGGKRPNAFSFSLFYSRQTDISSNYYNNAYMNSFYNNYYGGYGGYNNRYNSYNSLENFYDPDKSIVMFGGSINFGKRLKWPDDYFTISAELSYQKYILKQWRYFPVTNGNCNKLSLGLTISRNSTQNPIYPRFGSEFTFSVQATPPYSLFNGVDYSKFDQTKQEDVNQMHKWIEYHKWKFKSKTYTALSNAVKCPVLMTRLEFGLLGHYTQNKKSPFETFNVGGDGMTGYSSYATESVALRGYENGSLTPYGQEGYAYTRLGLEVRYPFMLGQTTIYGLAFAEAGNAWHNVSDFNPFQLKRSAGVGVRIFLPMIGMMGIDWAYGFDKVFGSKQYGGSQFHFVLGQEF